MAKIPFDIKYRPQIESGEYKVVTTKEQSVRIICWDRSTTYWKIVALVLAPDGKTENPFTYDVNGNESDGCLHNHELDLFVITKEPEHTGRATALTSSPTLTTETETMFTTILFAIIGLALGIGFGAVLKQNAELSEEITTLRERNRILEHRLKATTPPKPTQIVQVAYTITESDTMKYSRECYIMRSVRSRLGIKLGNALCKGRDLQKWTDAQGREVYGISVEVVKDKP